MYTIQIVSLSRSFNKDPAWCDFEMAKKCWTLRGARKEQWKWVNHEFGQSYLFRIVNSKGEVV